MEPLEGEGRASAVADEALKAAAVEVEKTTALDRGLQPLPLMWLSAGGLVKLKLAVAIQEKHPGEDQDHRSRAPSNVQPEPVSAVIGRAT